MRNLKKILAMVLALVMSLSLMATAGAASFPDVDAENPYATAIEVLDGLKVFQGFEDGTFKPTDTLNRAQAAVLVYRIATGDVENKYLDNYTFMQQSKFNDLDGYNWAKGYINYCQNAGIVVGTSATTFDPGAPVTGYQLLVMLLRTLGYGKAGEFTDPKGWELATAKIAEREGILKNVTGGDFGAPAPRQMVAEILFQGLLQETVQYSPLTPDGYTDSGVILGKNVGLEEITGVVVANEIADLNDTTPLDAGKTHLETEDGHIYTLDISSAATDIGETRHAYIQNGTKVLGVLADTGDNKINENPGVGTTLKQVIKDMNVRLTEDTQYYINFGDSEQYTCERRLEYSVTFDNTKTLPNGQTPQQWFESEYGIKVGDVVKNTNTLDEVNGSVSSKITYTRVIPATRNITEEDLTIMRGIFSSVDDDNATVSLGLTGYVFAGTNSANNVDRNKDLSEDLSWREFYKEYINPAAYNIDSSDNGEWFKVIDNDNDGNVDYVLLTRFVMTTITDYNTRTGYYTTEWTAESEESDHSKFLNIHKDDIVFDGELAIDDVILYAKIDGKYYVSHPETVDTSITKFNYKASIITCSDEQEREWSGIDKEAKAFFEEITDPDIVTKRPYTLYLDHFGYVRLVTDTSKGFVLLTDGYFETNRRDSVMKATVYDLAAGELKDVDVAKDNGASAYYFQNEGNKDQYGYIDTWEYDHNGNRGTWERLSTFGEYRYGGIDPVGLDYYGHYTDYVFGSTVKDPFWTNVALASYDEEKGEYTLNDIDGSDSRRGTYNSYELNGVDSDKFKASSKVLTGIVDWDSATSVGDTLRVNTTSQTRYYWVTHDKDGNDVVTTWVGYSAVPDGFSAKRGYAITSNVESTNNNVADYVTAEVVVFEDSREVTEYKAMIPYAYAQNKLAQGLGWDGEDYSDEARLSSTNKNDITGTVNDLFKVFDADTGKLVTDYGKYNVWAGRVVTNPETDYYQFSRDTSIAALADADPTVYGDPAADFGDVSGEKAYSITDRRTGNLNGYAVETTELGLGDGVIYLVDGKDNAVLVINIATSDAAVQADLVDLWNAIVLDYAKDTTAVSFFGKSNVVGSTITADYTDAKAYVAANGADKALKVDGADDYWLLTGPDGATVKNGQPDLADAKDANASYNLSFVDSNGTLRNYTLILEEADHDKELYYNKTTQISLEWEHTGGNTTFQLLKEMYDVEEGSTAEIVSWTFYDAKGNVIKDQSTSIVPGYFAEVVVADEGGNTQTFTIRFGRDDAVVTGALAAIDGKVMKVYFNTANGKVNLYRSEADAEANTGDTFIETRNTTTFASEGNFAGAARSVIVEALVDAGFSAVTSNDLLNVDLVTSNATTLDTSADSKVTSGAYTAMILKSDLTTPETANIPVQFIFVDTAARDVARAAKAVVESKTWDVYYSEWHSKKSDNYAASGSAEYVNRADAENLVKPDGTTSFGLPYANGENLGENSMLYLVNKALEDAGIDASIKLDHDTFVKDESKWRQDPDGSGSVYGGDTATYTANYKLYDQAGTASWGIDVKVTYRVNAVIVSWVGNMDYPQDEPTTPW